MKAADPMKYHQYLKKQKERSKKQREKLKKEMSKKQPSQDMLNLKQHQLEQQRRRQARYMANRTSVFEPKCREKRTMSTRKSTLEKREYNRLKKKESREKMTSQKKNWIKKKDRERKRLQRAKVAEKQEPLTSDKIVEKLRRVPNGKTVLKSVASELHVDGYTQVFLSKKLGVNRRTIKKLRSKERLRRRKTRINIKEIKAIYQRPDNSRLVPARRFATKEGPGYLLLTSVKEVHAKFLKENSSNVSFSTFAALRPRNVRLLSKSHREYCMCSYCMNIRNKLLCLESVIRTKLVNETNLLDILLCPKASSERFFAPACLKGTCLSCSNYSGTLEKRYESISPDKQLSWNRWEKIDNKVMLITKVGNKAKLLKEFVDEDIQKPRQGTTFLQHLHTAQWQQDQFSLIKTNLPDNWCLQVMDFAKNRGISYQEEVKNAFFTNTQITIHPIVSYYKKEGSSDLVRESCIVISEDLVHDFHAVNHYKSIVDEHLERQSGSMPEKFVVFSDGCAAQYKSKGPFADLSMQEIPTSRNFFGSEHGKNECDGETGILNRAVDRAIIGKKVVVTSPLDLYTYCKDNLELDEMLSKRRYFFVKSGDITRERPKSNVKPIKKTRQIHNIENTGTNYSIKSRNLSCFCQSCLDGSTSACLNFKYVEGFKSHKLSLIPECLSKDTRNEMETEVLGKNEAVKSKGRHNSRPSTSCKSGENIRRNVLSQSSHQESNDITDFETQNMSNNGKNESITQKAKNKTLKSLTMDGNLYQKILSSKSFEELEVLAEEYHVLPITEPPEVTVFTHKRTVDRASMALVPNDDDSLLDLFPTLIHGDGNCLPRCGSLFAYGSEDMHIELRMRIVLDLVKHKKDYLQMPSAKNFAMYSELYMGEKLTPAGIEQLFQHEVLAIREVGSFMGAWQMAALTNVLSRPVHSVYPQYGGQTVRKDLDHLFLPLENHSELTPVHIMWTNIHGHTIPQNQWRPNHFVTMMPLAPRTESTLVEDITDSPSLLGDTGNLECETVACDDSADTLKGDVNISSLLSNLECDTMAFDDSSFDESADTLKDLNITSLLSNLDSDSMELDGSHIHEPSEEQSTACTKMQRLLRVQMKKNPVPLGPGFSSIKRRRFGL